MEVMVRLEQVTCGLCHAVFAIGADFRTQVQQTGEEFSCPYCGRHIHYCYTENQKLLKQLEIAENRIARERAQHDQTKATLRDTESRRRAEKAAKTRIKNRVSNGVCPCCNRSFANLQRHMESKHPRYAETK